MASSITSKTVTAATAASISSISTTSTLTKWAMGGWMLFIGENFVLSENRAFLIDYFGDTEIYHAVYGACSTAAVASILYGWRQLRLQLPSSTLQIAGRASIPPLQLGCAAITMSLGLVLASQAVPKLQLPMELTTDSDGDSNSKSQKAAAIEVTTSTNTVPMTTNSQSVPWKLKVRCPFDFNDPQRESNTAAYQVSGLDRVTRHPGLWSLGLIAAGNAFLQPTWPLRIWMLGPITVAVLGGAHTDSRHRRDGTLDPYRASMTSNVPFMAILTGRQGPDALMQWLRDEIKPMNAALATLAACLYVISRGRITIKK